MIEIKCSPHNRGGKRNRNNVKYIVIHYTANKGDSAKNNGNYFARPHNPKSSAHFFIDQAGNIVQSVEMFYTAYSVGGARYSNYKKTGGAKYYRKCTNANSVSIELCDNLDKDPSAKQIQATKECIKYIRKYCPNAGIIIRHFDVTGKSCPARMLNESKWAKFKAQVE